MAGWVGLKSEHVHDQIAGCSGARFFTAVTVYIIATRNAAGLGPTTGIGDMISKIVFHNVIDLKKALSKQEAKDQARDAGHYVHAEDEDSHRLNPASKFVDGGKSAVMNLLLDSEDSILEKDSLLAKVVKLAHLEDMFATVIKDPVELAVCGACRCAGMHLYSKEWC
jgi:hypothetical protein